MKKEQKEMEREMRKTKKNQKEKVCRTTSAIETKTQQQD